VVRWKRATAYGRKDERKREGVRLARHGTCSLITGKLTIDSEPQPHVKQAAPARTEISAVLCRDGGGAKAVDAQGPGPRDQGHVAAIPEPSPCQHRRRVGEHRRFRHGQPGEGTPVIPARKGRLEMAVAEAPATTASSAARHVDGRRTEARTMRPIAQPTPPDPSRATITFPTPNGDLRDHRPRSRVLRSKRRPHRPTELPPKAASFNDLSRDETARRRMFSRPPRLIFGL